MYELGFLVGLVIAIVAAGGCVWFFYKKKVLMEGSIPKFDERQMVARGQCYKIAFFFMAFYYVVYGIVVSYDQNLLQYFGTIGIYTGIFISMGLFAALCILKEAYVGLNENRNWKMLFVIIGIVNIGLSVKNILRDGWIEDGSLSFSILNLECGIMMFVLLLVQYIKDRMDARED